MLLHDVFICHTSEDKEVFVRALAERLRAELIEVWYDEFSLKPGDSLRRSIDSGLVQSRYGIVVLSNAFFNKGWSQWELDGLVQKELAGKDPVLIPIWLDVDRNKVAAYSPSLADRVSILASKGMDSVVSEVLRVVRPHGSTLLIARDIAVKRGLHVPLVTDDWWLDLVEGSAEQYHQRKRLMSGV